MATYSLCSNLAGINWPWKTVLRHFLMPVRPMLLHRMALVSSRLFCKNLGNLQIDSYVRIFSLHMYAYVSASYDDCFVKIWATCENFLGKWFTAPPGRKLPVRLCSFIIYDCVFSILSECGCSHISGCSHNNNNNNNNNTGLLTAFP